MKTYCLLLSVAACLFGSMMAVQAQPIIAPPPVAAPQVPEEGIVVPLTSSPEGAIQNFLERYNGRQWSVLPDLIQGAERDVPALMAVAEQLEKARGTLSLRATDIQVVQEAGVAIATMTIHADNHLSMGMSWRETLRLHIDLDEKNNFRIWRLRPSEPSSLASLADPYVQRLITLIAYPKLTYLYQQRESAKQVKQLGLAAMQFIQDWDEKFDFTAENYKEKLQPYMRDARIWTAPGDTAGTQSYSFNPQLLRFEIGQLQNAAGTVMFYLGRDQKLDFRYGGKTVVGFADGHVEILDEEAAKKLRWKP